ncbi:hypothetical protein HRR90_006599 [Exophiala dermatitidis]|uniref:GNAT family acetyltransferase n=2 Tax=Exophiala dermatitidis TaxID=5970 RepID=H6BN19_EXODN|nr:GNAT family acetyltransferase [Exophiala dermatitidis NIH/UT8656]KAJ4514798.1 hypothetical protein HRR75_004162 [Exophiala dermatitidis]EHY52143.1 GNAT family acetyltransferase [Exophiala dermatitidis NIH/UT8656]KAJ4518256.1 hypothetical protein HRR74_004551 [Exophiala dermatitidis]KAJ4521154.1 hypothetical protein HRR73_003495 [Exophiala dermatitidis]KAJ4547743.1 hypothetical protein HRR76_000369 [Exophiala dermatitidis]
MANLAEASTAAAASAAAPSRGGAPCSQTKWHQPIGPTIPSSPTGVPPRRPTRVTLPGKSVTIQPLSPSHASDLYAIIEGESKAHLFTYLFDDPYTTPSAFSNAVTTKSQSEDPLFFALVDEETNRAVGWASLMRIDPNHRVVEVGNILFSPALQRTRAATEAMYLLARYVFEDLGYRRYEWKCDNLNLPSKRAAIRLGFTFEGVFRKHMVYKGRSRDTAWFAMVDEDWPVIKKAFEDWLRDENFDESGRQKRRLEDLRELMPGQRGPVVLEL